MYHWEHLMRPFLGAQTIGSQIPPSPSPLPRLMLPWPSPKLTTDPVDKALVWHCALGKGLCGFVVHTGGWTTSLHDHSGRWMVFDGDDSVVWLSMGLSRDKDPVG